MEIIGKNEELRDILLKKYVILDSEIKKVNFFYEQGLLILEIDFLLIKPSLHCKVVRLKLANFEKFEFYLTQGVIGYLDRYKLFTMQDGMFYFSLDPYDELPQPHEKDNGVFYAKEITGYCFESEK